MSRAGMATVPGDPAREPAESRISDSIAFSSEVDAGSR
jgi:hypothetical protein